jgi:zinc transporter ZupT
MLAASYWSLLAPAIDIVENSSADKRMSFVPVGIGFIAGGMFVYVADVIMVLKGITTDVVESVQGIEQTSIGEDKLNEEEVVMSTSGVRQRRSIRGKESAPVETKKQTSIKGSSWKRILLLIIAITVHNIPGLL